MRTSDYPAETNYLAGDVIADRYRLVRKLGEGGMGVVWVAHSLVLGVDIALKLIRASAARPGDASRMAREAQAAARLGHPALVRVFDFGWTTRGDPFLVMELAQGETLSSLLRRETRIGAIRAVQILLPIADGLRCAHEKGIVHRDIKPENVFIAADPFGRLQPKLLDFGIAKVDQTSENRLTQVGAVLGSPEFMSPEQARGANDIDARTDVWSMCVMLYEMITAKLPFEHENYNGLMQAILNDEPRPTTELGAGDVDLWRVVSKGLAKDLHERWESMTELGEALALWLYEHGVKEDISGNSVRALWLDGALSGVRPDVTTGAPGRLVSYTAAERATELTVPATDYPLWLRLRHWRRWLARRSRPLLLAGAGALGGVSVTWLSLSRESAPAVALPARHTATQSAPRVSGPPAITSAAPTPPPAPKAAEPPSPRATADPAPSESTNETSDDSPSQPRARAAVAPAPAHRTVKRRPRAINNFGF